MGVNIVVGDLSNPDQHRVLIKAYLLSGLFL